MPLDIQPLSATRRAVMVGVMLALLGASLGFAQLLINRKQITTRLVAHLEQPPGATGPLALIPVSDPGVRRIQTTPVRVGLAVRRMGAIEFGSDASNEPGTWEEDAGQVFAIFTNAGPGVSTPITYTATLLGDRPALQAIGEVAIGGVPGFAFIRVTELDGHGIAVCFSGTGAPTKADIDYFHTYCLHGVTIQVVVVAKKKG